jgi:hypothetical protein
MNEAALKFMEYDYKEIKELATQFLTLITAILVFSLAFSEKIVEYRKANQTVRNMLIASWSSFFLSIIGCGLSIVLNVAAAGEILYDPEPDFAFKMSFYSGMILVVSGFIFVLGLGFLIVSGIMGRRESNSEEN